MPLSEREHRGENDAGSEAEYTEDDRKRDVSLNAKHPPRRHPRNGPCCAPGDAHSDCTANASQPLAHYCLRAWCTFVALHHVWAKFTLCRKVPPPWAAFKAAHGQRVCVCSETITRAEPDT